MDFTNVVAALARKFARAVHSHNISDVSNLQTTLNGKQESSSLDTAVGDLGFMKEEDVKGMLKEYFVGKIATGKIEDGKLKTQDWEEEDFL